MRLTHQETGAQRSCAGPEHGVGQNPGVRLKKIIRLLPCPLRLQRQQIFHLQRYMDSRRPLGCGDFLAIIFARQLGNIFFVGEKSSFNQNRRRSHVGDHKKLLRLYPAIESSRARD